MTRLYILKDSKGKVVYEGNEKGKCLASRNASQSQDYIQYEFEVIGNDLLDIRTVNLVNDAACKPGEFRYRDTPSRILIRGAKPLAGLLKLLQSEKKAKNPGKS